MHRSKIGLIHLATKGANKMMRALVVLLNVIAPVAAINNNAIARTLKVVSMAGVIIGAGLVVVPVSEVQAQSVTTFVANTNSSYDLEFDSVARGW